ncbi:diguanylate cyclase [Pseudobacteroides cellulosolvens ATCC 35603 = DSM 2933]|uniref:Diguanylate cyclase n=1 Tax=Pseudobacteroides cellulosolvens ATCC 35603 = DSM 2933 TaxID=398512 RepID=A0A0L6JJH0_9FIRM|nr:diguanylate cyclase [Pseudobacteroides cellulosolvens]KNY25833.1 diguanylate cyclase [Pseudobacteroides cellulosolvens ATCC 35603 = DSM 2933]
MDIYKALLQNEAGRGEKIAWIFRWALYSLAFFLAAIVYFFQDGISGLFGMILSLCALLYNLIITYFIRKKLYYGWIRYTSATVDVMALTLYNAIDTYFHTPLVPVTTATILVYPCIIFLASLRLDRRLIIYSTLLTAISMDILYAFASPYFDPVVTKELSSCNIFGQAYRTIYILLCGFLMLFIPGTVERLLRNQREIYEKSISNYELAHKDRLTGVGNRMLLEEHLEKIHEMAVTNNLKYSVIFIDLDGFKEINDEYGMNWGIRFCALLQKE